uniref:Synaptonemal complex protein 1 n=1 Tax=Neolamprologus brichardi TaxID=32507 RepID=A0A3Q4GSR3_NEOBR
MERDRRFSFKLLVPPRVNNGPISAVQPQEIVEDRGDFMNAFECFDKEKNILFPNTNVVAPTKPPKQGICVSLCYLTTPNNCNPGQLYSKLFDEVEKIKCWKVKVYSDTVEKERRLQDNKRTIETQRKAIQELQFGNESLSIKLEEQISENEELRNKNNSTWNLRNILKETFDSSVEKIHLFEAEREETHDLLTENNESVKKLIAAFESLRVRVETDQQEMQKGIYIHFFLPLLRQNITMLQIKLKDKETQLQKLLLDLDESQKHCNELQQSTSNIIIRSEDKLCANSENNMKLNLKPRRNTRKRFVMTMKLAIKGVEWYLLSSLVYFQNKMLKKQMAQEIAKSSDLETTINSLQNESQNLKQLKGEEHEKLLKTLESKSTFAAELEKEVQKLRITAAEAIKNKEATELKCQHKIGDMVTLMEKHKSQYDRMVQEKDAELEEKKKNEMEATAREKSLVPRNMLSTASNYKQRKSSEVPKENSSKSHTFDFFKAKKTSSYSKDGQSLATRTTDVSFIDQNVFNRLMFQTFLFKISLENQMIKSYRIRTPPSEKSAQWGKSAIELDPKSDSSDQNDLLVNSQCKLHILKKNQSPLIHKSPGNSLKLAAMKRMRDAGWTAVTGCDKKKKKTNEKIFA